MTPEVTKQQLDQLATDVAQHMTGAWRFQPLDYQHCSRVADNEGHQIDISARDGRLTISGIYPRARNVYDCLPYNRQRPHITVSRDKTPQQIAHDIARRFWPAYVELWAEARKRLDAMIEDHRKRWEAADRLKRAANAVNPKNTVQTGGDRDSLDGDAHVTNDYSAAGGHFRARVYGDGSVTMEIRSASIETAERIVAELVKR